MITKNPKEFDKLFTDFSAATPDNPFGNMWMFMMMDRDNKENMLPLMMMSQGNMNMNTMMMYIMMQDKDNMKNILLFMIMTGQNPFVAPAPISAPAVAQ